MPISLETLPEKVDEAASEVERMLSHPIERANLPKNLEEAALYAVLNGGKRVRPALTLLCCEAVGGISQDAMPAALAIEYTHCFTLVHDDLPCLDDDELRRGKPTLHIHTSDAMALLTGE